MPKTQPDRHTVDPEQLVSSAATQLGAVAAYVSDRGSVDDAERLAAAAHALFTVVDQIDGYAAARAEMLRSAEQIALSHDADPDPYGRAMAGLDEDAPRRRAWRRLADWLRGGGRRDR